MFRYYMYHTKESTTWFVLHKMYKNHKKKHAAPIQNIWLKFTNSITLFLLVTYFIQLSFLLFWLAWDKRQCTSHHLKSTISDRTLSTSARFCSLPVFQSPSVLAFFPLPGNWNISLHSSLIWVLSQFKRQLDLFLFVAKTDGLHGSCKVFFSKRPVFREAPLDERVCFPIHI